MSRPKIKRKSSRESARECEAYSDVLAAAKSLHGTPLGAGKFIRTLSDKTLEDAHSIATVMAFITLHALAIVDGNPEGGVDEERASDALLQMPPLLQGEHLRRLGLVRIRYPRDPFTQTRNVWWCNDHPYVEFLGSIPGNGELKKQVFTTGDLTLLSGHFILLPPGRQRDIADRLEAMDERLDEVLAHIEEEFADAMTLASTLEKPFLVKS